MSAGAWSKVRPVELISNAKANAAIIQGKGKGKGPETGPCLLKSAARFVGSFQSGAHLAECQAEVSRSAHLPSAQVA